MSFVGPGQVVTYLYWIEQIQKLRLNDTSNPDEEECRLREESGEFYVMVYINGSWVKCNRNADLFNSQPDSFYLNAGNLNAGTIPLARIPTTLIGKSADQLDGQEGSFYLNASNMNAGTVARARLGASWRDTDSDISDSPFEQSGLVTVPTGTGTLAITFDYAYTNTPRVTVSSSNAAFGAISGISTTGFLVSKGTWSFDLNWRAIGRRV